MDFLASLDIICKVTVKYINGQVYDFVLIIL